MGGPAAFPTATKPVITAPRTHLVRALEAGLVGPFRRGLTGPNGEDGMDTVEELELPPSRWYLTGFLAPAATRSDERPERRLRGMWTTALSRNGSPEKI